MARGKSPVVLSNRFEREQETGNFRIGVVNAKHRYVYSPWTAPVSIAHVVVAGQLYIGVGDLYVGTLPHGTVLTVHETSTIAEEVD